MTNAIAKLMLENAETFLDRTEAIKTAMSLGMQLDQIEEYLDWLEMVRTKESGDEARSVSFDERPVARDSQRPKAG